jgi:Tol biopolymer transport system component
VPLAPGTRLGAYEIVAALGAGGMGEVYRATDTKLKRAVAIKILPRALAVDPERLARFQREAEVLASLNHPHIATVYGLENADAHDALVMELVEGEDLSRRLARGPIARDEALTIARQISEALEAAHERGIVHRDLKPANVMVRPDGAVKVLDFGLAKALDPQGEAPDASLSPTRTSPAMTRAGVMMGTAAYMSPEQARGKTVDRRADVWAFGCVLYEMLTGRLAFRGETVSDTIAAILEREPDWSALPASTPPGLRQVIKRCLEKDLKQRSRDIGDVRLQMDDAVGTAIPPPTAGLSHAARWWLAAVAVAVIATAAVVLPKLQRAAQGPGNPTTRFDLTRATADAGVTGDPALSRDGTLLAYASDRAGRGDLDIWIQQAAGGTPIQLTHDEVDEREPTFSPDGRLIAYRSEADGGGIYIIPSFGGQQPRLLVRDGRRPRFSPDGSTIAYWAGTNIGFNRLPNGYRTFVVPATGGTPREISGMTGARYPVWSRDGQSLIVLGSRDAQPQPATYDWWILPLGGGEPVKSGAFDAFQQAGISTASGNVAPDAWLRDRLLFSDYQYVWSVALDAGSGRTGDVERVTFGTTSDGQATVSDKGTIAFSSVIASDHIWSLPLDTRRGTIGGAAQRLTSGSTFDARPSMSADGSLLAYNHNTPKPGTFVKNLKDGSVTDLGVESSAFGPAISPDGRYVTYETTNGGVSVVPSRGGSPRVICTKCTIGDWADDSRATTVVMLDGNSKGHLTLVNVENGSTRDLTEPGAATLNRPFLSRGSRLLAFREFRNDASAVHISRVPAQGTIKKTDWIEVVPPERDVRACGWSPDGAMLYFLSSRDGSRCLYAQRVDPQTGTPQGDPFVVRHFSGARNMWAGQFGVLSTGPGDAMRGGSFLYDLAEASANIWMLSAR